jgi:hypothetical protein
MATLTKGEVVEFLKDEKITIELFGVSARALRDYGKRCRALGEIIMQEEGQLTPKEAMNLPKDTKLGRRAQKKFQQLQEWVRRQGGGK